MCKTAGSPCPRTGRKGKVYPQGTGLWLGNSTKEIDVSCISAHDPQLERLEVAIAQRVGQERYSVWFTNSTRLDLKQDELEIAVPNDFISEWIFRNFAKTIQEAAQEVLGCSLLVRYSVLPQLFGGHGEDGPVLEKRLVLAAGKSNGNGHANGNGNGHSNGNGNGNGHALKIANGHGIMATDFRTELPGPMRAMSAKVAVAAPRLRHDLHSFVVGG